MPELMEQLLLTIGISAFVLMLFALFIDHMAGEDGYHTVKLISDIIALVTSGILILEFIFVLGYWVFGAIWGWY